jgi:putative endonuclease
MYYVYFLFLNNQNIYKGITTDLKRRFKEHNVGKVASTKNKKPILIHYEAYLLKTDAERRERFLKTTEGRRLLKQQLKDLLNELGSSGQTTRRPVE